MIIQGTNLPLVIRFTNGIPNYSYIEVSLRYDGNEVKHWDKDTVKVISDAILCPLSQNETKSFDIGTYRLEVKLLDSKGATRFLTTKKIGVSPHYDNTVMGDGDSKFESEAAEEIIADIITGKIIYKGYSPYIGANKHWYIWSDEDNAFVDTGIMVEQDLSIYAKLTDLDPYAKLTDLEPYAKTTDLEPYAKRTELEPYAKLTDLDPYAKKTDLDPYVKRTELEPYAKTEDVVSKDSYETWVFTDRQGNEYIKLVYVKG